MRQVQLCSVVLVAFLVGALTIACSAQTAAQSEADRETNFPVGPQYLITTPSTLLLMPIATPELSLSEAPQTPSNAAFLQQGLTEEPQPLSTALPPHTNFAQIDWGLPQPPPSLAPAPTVMWVSSVAPSSNLPPDFMDVGVSAIVDLSTLHEMGYGWSVAEAAHYWKTHEPKPHAKRVYTNADLEHPPSS